MEPDLPVVGFGVALMFLLVLVFQTRYRFPTGWGFSYMVVNGGQITGTGFITGTGQMPKWWQMQHMAQDDMKKRNGLTPLVSQVVLLSVWEVHHAPVQ